MIPAVGSKDASAGASLTPRAAPPVPRILIVEEAVTVRATLLEILHKLNVPDEETAFAATPEDALAFFGAGAPRLVFAELIGARPDEGLDLVHEMLDRAPACKIVLLTAEPRDAAEVRAALRAGIFAFIEKPVRYEKIRQVLSEVEAEEGGIERMR